MDDIQNCDPNIDRIWLQNVVSDLQIAIGHACGAEIEQAHLTLARAAQQIRPPTNSLERLVLRSIAHDLIAKGGEFLHARLHRARHADCSFIPAEIAHKQWEHFEQDPRQLLLSWTEAFFPALIERHPPTTPQMAARLVRQQYTRAWTMTRLAETLGTTSTVLSAAFEGEFGMSVRTYQRMLRIVAALERLRTDKVEAVALEVGFRSRKNFYRALLELTGLTPSGFRRLSDRDAVAMTDALRRALARVIEPA